MGHLCYLRKAAFAALCRICRMCGIQVDHLYPDGDAATEGETVRRRRETRRRRCASSPVRLNPARDAPTRPGQSVHIPSQRPV
ncbi:hypothetical protein D1J63_12865 [Streptomyces sp. KPB2]|nr:hypothetical protein D1J63_12865 [Streptomyces sp. KPB2]NDZ71969.1 hypothetical protein [Streptomyces sp. SID10362]